MSGNPARNMATASKAPAARARARGELWSTIFSETMCVNVAVSPAANAAMNRRAMSLFCSDILVSFA